MLTRWFKKPKVVTFTPVLLGILALLFAVACGSAAAPETTAPDTAASAPTAPTSVPVTAPAAITDPQDTAPMEAEVNPGKLTVMVGTLGNEQFDGALRSGAGTSVYGRILNAFLVNGNREKQLIPGIASE